MEDVNKPFSRQWRMMTSGIAQVFCFYIIAWTTLYGTAGNSLHASAQSWAFTLAMVLLVGEAAVLFMPSWTKK